MKGFLGKITHYWGGFPTRKPADFWDRKLGYKTQKQLTSQTKVRTIGSLGCQLPWKTMRNGSHGCWEPREPMVFTLVSEVNCFWSLHPSFLSQKSAGFLVRGFLLLESYQEWVSTLKETSSKYKNVQLYQWCEIANYLLWQGLESSYRSSERI